jgi:hypothetical protein
MIDVPKKVKIGPQWYRVEQRKTGDDGMLSDESHAYTLGQRNLIVLSSELDASNKKQVLVHEILHAIHNTLGSATRPVKTSDFADWEHHFISMYEVGLLMVLQDNPDLVKYLTETET